MKTKVNHHQVTHPPHRKNRAWILLLGLLIFEGFPSFVLGETSSDSSSPKTFLQRLRAPFEKQNSNPVSEVPEAFSEPGPMVQPAALKMSDPGSANPSDGWEQIGTSYTVPNSGMQPDPTSMRSYNPSTRPQNSTASPQISVLLSNSATNSVGEANAPNTQKAASGNLPDVFPVNNHVFYLPFENFLSMVPENQLKELRIYVSMNRGGNWNLYQTLSKEKIQSLPKKTFPVQTRNDGEYWVAIRVVDIQGKETPNSTAPPTWRVAVNTTGKPSAIVNPLENKNQTPSSDLNAPDTNPLIVSDANERPQWSPNPDGPSAETTSKAENQEQNSSQNPNLVIFSVKDRNQSIPNVSLQVFKIPNSKASEFFLNHTNFAENTKTEGKHSTAKPSEEEPQEEPQEEAETNTELDVGEEARKDALGADGISIDDSLETPEVPQVTEPASDDMILTLTDVNEEGLNSKIRYLNEPTLSIDYDVSTVGSSGVGRVELWGTLDDGQTWTYMAEDKDCTSPMDVNLKSDGKYGFQILIFNGAGVGMERPESGSAPQMEVVLDRINPRVQLYGIQLQAEFGDLEVKWGAEDLNLGSNPVLLSWSSAMEGPWQTMTSLPLENTGNYTWRIPDKVPGKVYIRIDVCDQSKNSTTLVTGPVVTDIVRPTGVIRDAKPVNH